MKQNNQGHQSGFVSIIGLPNVGKSTLLNQLVGENLSIVTHKPQTTRHRILGIVSEPEYQIVLSDVPGYIAQKGYLMHQRMNDFVHESFEDADLLLVMADPGMKEVMAPELIEKIKRTSVPKVLMVNKIDEAGEEELEVVRKRWEELLPFDEVMMISAREESSRSRVISMILKYLPEGPIYFPKDQLADRDVRFFVSEFIREEIFLQYRQEIPYSSEVDIEDYTETEEMVHIHAMIYVERKSQKFIMIGKNGSAIKQLGIESRKRIEEFIGKKVFLQLHVKVREKWRDNQNLLQRFGY